MLNPFKPEVYFLPEHSFTTVLWYLDKVKSQIV